MSEERKGCPIPFAACTCDPDRKGPTRNVSLHILERKPGTLDFVISEHVAGYQFEQHVDSKTGDYVVSLVVHGRLPPLPEEPTT